VVSLTIRRQLALWKDGGTYLVYGVPYETGLTIFQDVVYLGCLALALVVWSWTSGFVSGSLSGRAVLR
jgi:hypothetical protein